LLLAPGKRRLASSERSASRLFYLLNRTTREMRRHFFRLRLTISDRTTENKPEPRRASAPPRNPSTYLDEKLAKRDLGISGIDADFRSSIALGDQLAHVAELTQDRPAGVGRPSGTFRSVNFGRKPSRATVSSCPTPGQDVRCPRGARFRQRPGGESLERSRVGQLVT
jgi:hypothetical protein